MPLVKQNLQLTFSKGLDHAVDAKCVISSRFKTLDNLEWRDRDTVRQRPGYTAATLTAQTVYDRALTAPRRLGAFRDTLVVEGTSGFHRLNSGVGSSSVPPSNGYVASAVAVAPVFERASLRVTEVGGSQMDQETQDVAVHGDLELFLWTETDPATGGNGYQYLIRNRVTGAIITQPLYNSTTCRFPRVVSRTAGFVIVLMIPGAPGTISGVTINVTAGVPSTPGNFGAGTIINSVHADGLFDVWAHPTQDIIGIAYKNSTAAKISLVSFVASTGAVAFGPTEVGASATVSSISVGMGPVGIRTFMLAAWAEAGNDVLVSSMRLDNGTVSARVVAAAGGTYLGTIPDRIRVVACPLTVSNAQIFFDYTHASGTTGQNGAVIAAAMSWDAAAFLNTSLPVYGCVLAGRPANYTIGGISSLVVPLSLSSALQPKLILRKFGVTVSHNYGIWSNVLGRVERFGGWSGTPVPTVSGNGIRIPMQVLGAPRFVAGSDQARSVTSILTLDFDAALPSIAAQDSLFLTGGCPHWFDGLTLHEAGFHYYPETGTPVAAAGGSLSAGQYSFIFLFEWQDATGKMHRSETSVPLQKVAAVNNKITIPVTFMRFTEKEVQSAIPTRNSVRIACFRTEANGSVYYRDVEGSGTTSYNEQASAIDAVWVSDITDASLISNELLYTTGGGLDNESFPACDVVATHQRRLFMATDGGVQYTDEIDEHTQMPATNEVYFLPTPPEGGDVTNLASMDDKLIIVCEKKIYGVFGQGPNRLGQQNSYSLPEVICAQIGGWRGSPESAVLCPEGLWFLSSQRGLRLLTRGLTIAMNPEASPGQPAYLGTEVDDLFADTFKIVRGCAIPSQSQVRWYLGGSESGVVCLDYQQKQWSHHTNYNSNGGAVACNGQFWHSDTTNVFSSNLTEGGLDGSTVTAQVLESAWIALSDRQGFQRLYALMLLGEAISAGTIQVEEAYDYSDTYISTVRREVVAATGALKVTFAGCGPGTTYSFAGGSGTYVTGQTSAVTAQVYADLSVANPPWGALIPASGTLIVRAAGGGTPALLLAAETLKFFNPSNSATVGTVTPGFYIPSGYTAPLVGDTVIGVTTGCTGTVTALQTGLGTGDNHTFVSVSLTSGAGFAVEDIEYWRPFKYTLTKAENPLQIDHRLSRQKCESFRFRLTITPGSSAECLRLTSFALSVGLKTGLNRLPGSQKF